MSQEKLSKYIQEVIDNAPAAKRYCADGCVGYLDGVFSGEYIRNGYDKSNTFTVESVNADLRHYTRVLAKRSRCFCLRLETLQAVVDVFIQAYNRCGIAKYNFMLSYAKGEFPLGLVDFL